MPGLGSIYSVSCFLVLGVLTSKFIFYFTEEHSDKTLNGGYVFFGFIIPMVLLSLLPLGQKHKTQIKCMIVSTVFAHSAGRIGCYLNDCCFGALLGFPVQIIEALFLFILGKHFLKKNILKVNLLRHYVFTYGAFRFLIELFREDEARGLILGLYSSQFISLVLVAIIFVHWKFFEQNSQAHKARI